MNTLIIHTPHQANPGQPSPLCPGLVRDQSQPRPATGPARLLPRPAARPTLRLPPNDILVRMLC